MAQHDYNIANQGFSSFRSDLNNALSAVQTTNSGTSRPTGAVAGQLWLDTTTATSPTLKYYDGADDISLATIDHTANTVNWLDSTVSITGLSTTATGTVLTLSDSATTSTVNLIIDNDKEIRFREATANGTNYVSLSAPASLSADLTFQLPATDGTVGQALITNGSGVLSFTTISAGTSWQSVQTTGFTAVAGRGYPCNTTSSAFTVTLPASPSVGDYIQIVDYAGTFGTNNLTVNPNGLKIQTGTGNRIFNTNRIALTFTYIDSTQGWLLSSGYLESTNPFYIAPYSVDFLVVAGGGGGGGAAAFGGTPSAGGGAGGYRTSTQTVNGGTVITVTVGDGGAGQTGSTTVRGNNGSDSSISGSGLTTITSTGGGGGGAYNISSGAGGNGGSGGGAPEAGSGGTGTVGQGNNGGEESTSAAGGGGGAGAVGQNAPSSSQSGAGGAGSSSSITGSSVTRAGGGGGGGTSGGIATGAGGAGGGGAGGGQTSGGTSGTVNTGGGGGGGGPNNGASYTTSSGGKGVVILSVPTASYSSNTSGSPTVTTSGSNTILQFNGTGSYTA
jgi:hypothetical protein